MIHIGTSGYSYKDWIGPFYPEHIKDGDMLGYYSQTFGFTEINSTYYKIPNPYMFYNMQKKTTEDFVFTVKLHQSMTHSRDAGDAEYSNFNAGMKVLEEAGKLGCLVAQFPYSFHCNRENADYILKMKEKLAGFKLVVEFRNNRWINAEVFDILRKNEIGYVCVDEPEIAGLVGKLSLNTSGTAYIRFHGRNKEKWYNHKEAYERYDYLYSEQELVPWVEKIKGLSFYCDDCFVSFNNHFQAKAVSNGIMLRDLLEGKKSNE